VSFTYPYEILVIIDSRPTDEEVAALLTQLGETLTSLGATVSRTDNWGKRRLAYDIRKQREGTYAVYEASAEPAMVKEFERQLRLNENVLRFLSTRVPVRRRARPKTQEPPPQGDKVLEEVG
jgi:small subunit ribosomal protein S6